RRRRDSRRGSRAVSAAAAFTCGLVLVASTLTFPRARSLQTTTESAAVRACPRAALRAWGREARSGNTNGSRPLRPFVLPDLVSRPRAGRRPARREYAAARRPCPRSRSLGALRVSAPSARDPQGT